MYKRNFDMSKSLSNDILLKEHSLKMPDSMERVLANLEYGTTMTRFYASSKRRPENRVFYLKPKQLLLSWCRTPGREEGTVLIHEIKEIRRNNSSKDFEKNTEYLKKVEADCCMVIMYGDTFNLKTISCIAQNAKECSNWVDALNYLKYSCAEDTYKLKRRWLEAEWQSLIPNNQTGITMKELRQFLFRNNIKMTIAEMTVVFKKFDCNNNGVIDFNEFKSFFETVMSHQTVVQYFYTLSKDRKNVQLKHFRNFLMIEQKEQSMKNTDNVKKHITEYLGEERKPDPYLTFSEFLDYIFSKKNSVFGEEHREVYQDMTQPLSQYWIASSHNTYLTGNQLLSESSVEAYVRCLRMGCRCVELDCWDGPDSQPVIYHGKTMTSKITFMDVIKAIKENAFAVSEYPLILSIENHCSLLQQRVMAQAFIDVFGDYLLTSPVDPNEECLPSPEQLKYKIILKYKKLATDPNDIVPTETATDDVLYDSTMDGILFLEDEIDKVWRPHFFVLNKNILVWSEEQTSSQDKDEEEDDEENDQNHEVSDEELHFAQPWFHRGIDGQKATKLLQSYNKGNGSFLVRESAAVSGGYSISFWRNGAAHHCRVKAKQVDGETKYSLGENDSFVNLYSLVDYYQARPLRTPQYEILLTEPVKQPNAHVDKEWFHKNLTRADAENMLIRAPSDGSFLIRQKESSDDNQEAFAISFKAEGRVKHCRIIQEGRLYSIGTAQFESLVDLVDYYKKYPLYRKIKLKYAINEKIIEEIGIDVYRQASDVYQELYLDPTFCTKPVCRALWDYTGTRESEMSFCKGAFITSVVKEDGGWWLGDFAEYKQAFFPANYCEEINVMVSQLDDNEDNNRPLGESQKGSLDISSCKIDPLPPRGGLSYLVRIMVDGQKPLEIGAKTIQDMETWVYWIKSASDETRRQSKKLQQSVKPPVAEKIDKLLSDLVVYCRSVPFNFDIGKGRYYEMSSLSESKIEKYMTARNSARLVQYNQNQFTRVYPKGTRVESTNYDPNLMWNCGAQMCALNYQTPDRSMQLNQGKFLDNGGCGYVLKPSCMKVENFNPYGMLKNVTHCSVSLKIIAGRHLPRISRRITSPFVEVEIIGAQYDTFSYKTKTVADNGLNPVYNDTLEFDVICPPLAYIRFVVYDEDTFGDPNFVGQAVFPFLSLRQGYRSVPLKNAYSEDLEMSSLLIYLDIFMDEDEDIYTNIHDLRSAMQEISSQIGEEVTHVATPDLSLGKMKMLDAEFREKQSQLQMLMEQRKEKKRAKKSKDKLKSL